MIKRIDKIVLRDVAVSVLITVLGMTFLFTAVGLYQIVSRFPITPRFGTLMSFAPSLWISLLPFSLPVSVLVSSALVFGRMRAEHELLLLSASGVPPWRPFVALVPLGLVTAALSGYAVSEMGPAAYVERDELQRKALADFIDHPPPGPRELRFSTSGSGMPGVKITGVDISYGAFDGGHFEDLAVIVHGQGAGEEQGLIATLTAQRARLVYQRQSSVMLMTGCVRPRLVTYDPATGAPAGEPPPLVAERINELRMPFEFGRDESSDPPKAMATRELLQKAADDAGLAGKQGAAGEIVRRAGLAGAGLLALLGALLAALVNHPNRLLAVGVGVVPSALIYYPPLVACQSLAENGTLGPLAATIAPLSITIVAIGALLFVHWRRGWA